LPSDFRFKQFENHNPFPERKELNTNRLSFNYAARPKTGQRRILNFALACQEAREISAYGSPAYVHQCGIGYTVLTGRFARMGAIRRYSQGKVI